MAGRVRECLSLAVWNFSREAGEFDLVLQRKHADLFTAGVEEDRTAHLKLVSALNRELAAASLLP